jgi:hypothetical protein
MEKIPSSPQTDPYLEALTFQDALVSDEERAVMREWGNNSESARRYAVALKDKEVRLGGPEKLKSWAEAIYIDMLQSAKELELPVSAHGHSRSWVLWDIAKQHYYLTHPDEADSRYSLPSVENMDKMNEISLRHLGWEAYKAFQESSEWKSKIRNRPFWAKVKPYLERPPKENGTLSSLELAELGAALTGRSF